MLPLPPWCCRLCLPPWPGVKPFNVTKLTKESWLGMAPHVLIPLQKAPQGARPNPKSVPFTTGCFSHDGRASQAL